MDVKVRRAIKHNGKRYAVGQVIEGIDVGDAKRLIQLGAAEETVIVISSEIDDDLNPSRDLGLNDGEDGDELTDQEVVKLIDEHFKLDVLKDEADSLGIEFPGNISKTKLIAHIIEEGHENHFLDQIPE